MSRRLMALGITALSLLLLQPRLARAQTATALDRLEPAPAGDALLTVPSAEVPGAMRPAGAVLFSYAHAPLVLKRGRGDARETLGDIVDHQLTLHVLASLEVFRRVAVEVDVPFTLSAGGDAIEGTLASPSGAAMNDVRGGVRLQLVRQDGALPAVALAGSMWFPTGDDAAYSGTGEVRYAPGLIVSGTYPSLVWSATGGRRFQDAAGGLIGGEIYFGAGVAPRFGALQIGPEVFGTTVADRGVAAFTRGTTNLEATLAARYRVGPVTFSAGAGPGITSGVGTPDFRLLAGVAIAPDAPPPAPETDDAEARARAAADAEAARKARPAVAVTPAPVAEPDRDGDRVADVVDGCPEVKGVESLDPAKNGCPADTDGDGIVDAEDACPAEKGARTADPRTNGCPASVRVEGTQIIILEQVHFATGRDEIEADSFPLLAEVAAVMDERPDIARVAVDGHTDAVGDAKSNIALSQRRAVAVVRWLTEHGVDARRLEARGFGPRRPIAANLTSEGRAKNRRVEFQIRLRTPEGAAGWRDGPIE